MNKNNSRTTLLIAGSRRASPVMNDYARRVVKRASQLAWTVIVGDNPNGIDTTVAQTCQLLNVPFYVAGIDPKPRNGNILLDRHHYIQITLPDPSATKLASYTLSDQFMVDFCDRSIFIWNGTSQGTITGYNYAVGQGKPANLIRPKAEKS